MSLCLKNLSVSFGKAEPLFAPITVDIGPRTIVTVMGRSGIGKSTLLDAIAGHLPSQFRMQGSVLLDGRDVTALPAEARGIGMMFQDSVLFAHLSVGDNLAFGLQSRIKGRAARRAKVEEALSVAGLSGFHDRDPATLSGGQRARAALMRTLLAEPRALLLDEPFSRLDVALRSEIRGFVFDHAAEQNLPVLLVTHDEADAAAADGPVISL